MVIITPRPWKFGIKRLNKSKLEKINYFVAYNRRRVGTIWTCSSNSGIVKEIPVSYLGRQLPFFILLSNGNEKKLYMAT